MGAQALRKENMKTIIALALPAAACAPSPALAGRHGAAPATREDTMHTIKDGAAPGADCRRTDQQRLREALSPLQYHVTQEGGTEAPFANPYWNEHRRGLYVDVVSGVPLFASTDKFDSGTGWPSFTRPIAPDAVTSHEDRSLWPARTEVRSREAGSHLGHVFDDGPAPTGLRYCINSAALRFVQYEDMEREGYGAYLHLFNQE